MMPRSIVIVSSLDTKGQEVKFLKTLIEQRGHKTLLLDMSMRCEPQIPADVSCEEVAKAGGTSIQEIKTSTKSRSEITSIMIEGAIRKVIELYQTGKLDGIVGVGGVSNTAMGTDIMKALPFGVPKLDGVERCCYAKLRRWLFWLLRYDHHIVGRRYGWSP